MLLSARAGLAAALSCSVICSSVALGQTTPFLSIPGEFGEALDLAGDYDGDGVVDLIVGSGPMFGQGAAYVLSPLDGAVLLAIQTPTAGPDYGSAVAGLGDLDGDGIPDFGIGGPQGTNPNNSSGPGRLEVVSGATGALLFAIDGAAAGDRMGAYVDAAGDVNADGVPDVVVSAPGSDVGVPDGGLVRVLSGVDGSVLLDLPGDRDGYSLGSAVTGLGDLNGDGHGDFLAASLGAQGFMTLDNLVYVYSGIDGSVLYRLSSPKDYDLFGFDAAALGDVDLDGVPDFAVASPLNGARVRVYSGVDGAVLHKVYNGGFAVSGIGDYDGDGYADFVTSDEDDGSVTGNGGQLAVYSGRDKSLLDEFFGVTATQLGHALAAGGDVNGDGKPDIYGYARASSFAGPLPTVNVYLGGTRQVASYCTAGVSSNGCAATLSASGIPSATAGSGFLVSATGVEGAKSGLYFFGVNGRQAQPWAGGAGYQCVLPPVRRGALIAGSGTAGVCDGTFSNDLNVRWASKPGQNPGAGAVTQIQLWYRDPSATGSTSLSDAIEVTVAP